MESNNTNEKLTQSIHFRTTAETKMMLHSQATALGMNVSEYLNLIIQDYENMKKKASQPVKTETATANKPAESKKPVENLNADQIKEIRQQAIKEYQEQQLGKNGGKTPYIEVNKQLTDRLKRYETKELKALFEKTKGQTALIKDSYGNTEKIKIEDMPDVVAAVLESFKVKVLNEKV